MNEHSIELIQTVLGLEPFVLLTFVLGDDGEDDLRLRINAGGGIVTNSEIREALLMALEGLEEVEDAD